jgi:hypothetical protein
MSIATYLLHGSRADPSLTRAEYAPMECVQFEDSCTFEGTIESETREEGIEYHFVDRAIGVKDVTPEVKERYQTIWENYAFQSALAGAAPLVFLAVSTAVCSATGMCGIPDVLTLPAVLLCSGGWVRAMEAMQQRAAWGSSYAQELASARKHCADHKKGGFEFLVSNDLRGKVVSEKEVSHLWLASIEHYKTEMEAMEKKGDAATVIAFYRDFFARAPLDQDSLTYAEVSEETAKGLANAFEECRATFQRITTQEHWFLGESCADSLTMELNIPVTQLLN